MRKSSGRCSCGGSGSVLITGAAGGVGHLAVQLAKFRGIRRVVAGVSSAVKADFVRGLGADEVVSYASQDWGEPVDAILDGVGGDLLPRAIAALAQPGGGTGAPDHRDPSQPRQGGPAPLEESGAAERASRSVVDVAGDVECPALREITSMTPSARVRSARA